MLPRVVPHGLGERHVVDAHERGHGPGHVVHGGRLVDAVLLRLLPGRRGKKEKKGERERLKRGFQTITKGSCSCWLIFLNTCPGQPP